MKKVLSVGFALVLVVILTHPLWAITSIYDLRNQVKMTLAQGEPEFTDDIIDDFLILALQNVAENGLAFESCVSGVVCSSQIQSYVFSTVTGTGYYQGQGLFVKALTKDEKTLAHRSIWEITPKDLGRKWLLNPPAYQYYYIWHGVDSSYFSFYAPPADTDTVRCFYCYVPTTFKEVGLIGVDGYIPMPVYFEDVVIELTLFFCYVRLKDWNSAFMAFNKYSKNLSAIRELHINRQVDVTFGPQEIEE